MSRFDIHSLIKRSVWGGIGGLEIKTKDNAGILFLLTFIWYKVRYFLKPVTHQAGGPSDKEKKVKAWVPSIFFSELTLGIQPLVSLQRGRQRRTPAWLDLILCFFRPKIVNSLRLVHLFALIMSIDEFKRKKERKKRKFVKSFLCLLLLVLVLS